MSDFSVRDILLSRRRPTLASHRAVADLMEVMLRTQLAIRETQEMIRRSDLLIQSISENFGGQPENHPRRRLQLKKG